MGTILGVLGLLAQLRSSGFFGGSNNSQPTYTVPGKYTNPPEFYRLPDVGVRRNQF